MTAFGGLYTVRGYDEYEFVADGGILASLQYEFDLVSYDRHKKPAETEEEATIEGEEEAEPIPELEPEEEPNMPAPSALRLRKLAPLVFVDYGKADIKNPLPGEKSGEELSSVGAGAILELGDNFSGAVYYGYPLIATDFTRKGKGRVSVSMMLRF
jgi:hemolysin activation/secretion protein